MIEGKKTKLMGKLLIGLLAVFLAVPAPGQILQQIITSRQPTAAIALDNTGSAVSALNVSSLTYSYTVNGNTNGVLYVGVEWFAAISVSSITYNGVALTAVKTQQGSGNNAYATLWRLKAPETGTHDIVITMSGSTGATSALASSAMSLTGVDQSTPEDNTAGCNTASAISTVTCSITVNTANSWLMDSFSTGATGAPNPSATSPQNVIETGYDTSAGDPTRGSSYKGQMSTGAQTMSWTISETRKWATVVVAIKPAP